MNQSGSRIPHAWLGRLPAAFAAWLLILALAVANGAFRDAFLFPRLGNPAALLTSGIVLMLCIHVVAHVLVSRCRPASPCQCFGIGVFWLLLTLAFEFGFGRAQGKSWAELLDAYSFRDGNLWPLVLLTVLAAPWLAARRSRPH
jgi:hypothetical protein